MQLEDIMLSEVNQVQKDKGCILSLIWGISSKNQIYTQKQTWSYINSYVEHICDSGTNLWNSVKEEKEKRMIECQQYYKT
jgi:hypothetical protein